MEKTRQCLNENGQVTTAWANNSKVEESMKSVLDAVPADYRALIVDELKRRNPDLVKELSDAERPTNSQSDAVVDAFSYALGANYGPGHSRTSMGWRLNARSMLTSKLAHIPVTATAAQRRVEAALTGDLGLHELSVGRVRYSTPKSPRPLGRDWRERITGRCWPNAVSPPWLSTSTVKSSSTALTGRRSRFPRDVKRGTPDVLRTACVP